MPRIYYTHEELESICSAVTASLNTKYLLVSAPPALIPLLSEGLKVKYFNAQQGHTFNLSVSSDSSTGWGLTRDAAGRVRAMIDRTSIPGLMKKLSFSAAKFKVNYDHRQRNLSIVVIPGTEKGKTNLKELAKIETGTEIFVGPEYPADRRVEVEVTKFILPPVVSSFSLNDKTYQLVEALQEDLVE